MRGLIVAVACCAVIAWSARSLWETWHPAVAVARGLRSDDAARRARATRELMSAGETDPGRAIPPLIEALGDPDVQVRAAAIEALGAIGDGAARGGSANGAVRAAMARLIRSLKDREASVRIAAIHALWRIVAAGAGSGAVDPQTGIDAIASVLNDGDEEVRRAAFRALEICGPRGPDDPPAALVAALKHPSAGVRAAAISALASFRCALDPWLPLLLWGLEHDEREVRGACWAAFARGSPPAFSPAAIPALVKALGSGNRIVRARAARALEPHAPDPRAVAAVPALLAILKEPIDRGSRRLEPWSPGLPADLDDADPVIPAARFLARQAPGTKSAGEVIAALTEVARSDDPVRRQASAAALAEFGPAAEPAVPVLLQVLRKALAARGDSYSFEDRPVAEVLARIAPGTTSAGETIAALTEVMRSGPSDRWGWASDALGAFGPAAEPAVPALVQALKQTLAVKDQLAYYGPHLPGALGRIAPGTKSADAAVAALSEALDSRSEVTPLLRLEAIGALPAFGAKASVAVPRLRAWESDSRLGKAATAALEAIEDAQSKDRNQGKS
jgi:HEAT repeat protein